MAQASPSTFASHGAYSYGNAPRSPLDSNASPAIDPSISASSPTYPPHQQYSPYAPQDHMQYGAQPGQPMAYAPRPEWAGHYGPPPMYGHVQAPAGGAAPGMPGQAQRPPPVYYGGYPGSDPSHADPARQGGHPLSTVYSFVPIPGAQQHKRPRRRYEEIERMYKCGWNGCEKAYGTLNHLNAHVTMQSHGNKRTPEGKRPLFSTHCSFPMLFVFTRRVFATCGEYKSDVWRWWPRLFSLALGCLRRFGEALSRELASKPSTPNCLVHAPTVAQPFFV